MRRRFKHNIVIALGFFIFFCVHHALRRRRPLSATLTVNDILSSVRIIIEDAITDVLAERHTGDDQPVLFGFSNFSLKGIQNMQEDMLCYDERTTGHYDKAHKSLRPPSSLRLCPPSQDSFPELELCSLFRSKKILIVGPEAMFHLHSLLLDTQSIQENRSFSCLGPEFCTFHHICLPTLIQDEDSSPPKERAIKPPSPKDLVSTGSALLRYMLSSTLHPSSDPGDPMFTLPFVSRSTGVRLKETYWLGQARRSNLVILNRGPCPAPAWTYSGDWSFVEDIPLYLHPVQTQAVRIVNAALHVTLTAFLPEITHTLWTLRADGIIKHTRIVWYSTWYIPSDCLAPPFGEEDDAFQDITMLKVLHSFIYQLSH